MLQRIVSLLLVVALCAPGCATRAGSRAATPGEGQDPGHGGQLPASYLQQLPVGRQVEVGLRGGERFKATFMGVEGDSVRLQPAGRIPVPPQTIPIADLTMMRLAEGGGTSSGKALLIGMVAGAATFLGLLFVSFAAWAD